MFEMQLPWWELILRATVVYFGVLIIMRLSGKRTMGEFSPFDVVVLLLLSEGAQNALVADDHSLQGGLIVIATLVGLNYTLAFIATRSRKAESLLEGEPVTLIRDGKRRDDALRRNNIPAGDLAEAMRAHGIRHESEVQWAVLEADGKISFFKRDASTSEGAAT